MTGPVRDQGRCGRRRGTGRVSRRVTCSQPRNPSARCSVFPQDTAETIHGEALPDGGGAGEALRLIPPDRLDALETYVAKHSAKGGTARVS